LPPLDCLTAALEAMRAGSFSTAAVTLGVTHAAISRRVAGAEAWAGMRLFERHGRGVRPTPDGQRLLTRLAQQFEDIAALVERSRQPRARESVKLALTPAVARFWLLPRLAELEGDDLRVEILASHRHADLKAGEADLAIRYGRGNWGLGPETPLFAETLVPVGASGALVDQDNPRAVLAQPLIHSADSFLWRSWARRHGAGYRPKASDRTLADYALAIDVVLAGLGVGLWNQGLHALPSGLTTLERFELSDPPLRYYLIQPKGRGSEAIATLVGRFVSARGRLAAIGALSAQNQSR
jgi:DNA-binding transcriptional LysR family regulator